VDLGLARHGLPLRYYPDQETAIMAVSRSMEAAGHARGAQWLLEQRRLAQHPLSPKFLADHAAQTLLVAVRGRRQPA
jgi:DNA polymerase-3 subunit delta'